VLRLIAETPNLCKSLHMPAQHGSSSVLARMHRGYSREAYLALVSRARHIIAGNNNINNGGDDDSNAAVAAAGIALGLSSDFIAGFCGETEEEHREHLSLLTQVKYA
jgi:tRNA A37 methylthiotransferase MiaB